MSTSLSLDVVVLLQVDRMKVDSEAAAEELIQLRGRHQSLKKSHQVLTQRLAQYVDISRRQEQLLNATQQEIAELKQRRASQMPFNGDASFSNGHGEMRTRSAMNGLHSEVYLAFQSDPLAPPTVLDPLHAVRPPSSGESCRMGLCEICVTV